MEFTLFHLTEHLPICFKVDTLGLVFALMYAVVFICVGIYSIDYFEDAEKKKSFYIWFFPAWIALTALSFAANIVTFYMFFEFLTLTTFPMVFIDRTKESILASLKYLLYSLAGAYTALFGLFFVVKYSDDISFKAGGILPAEAISSHPVILLICAFCMIVGFGVKAGLFPMHAWLPTAHPVAPSPASALLSGVIVKAGILGIFRVVFEVFGADFIRGTWVQKAVIVLSLITIILGSMVALGEEKIKKRLAYSTVSQLSYIVFGIMLLNEAGICGAILQTVSHALCKSALFMCAGNFLHRKIEYVSDLNGIGPKMRGTIWGFIIASMGLIGIPPTLGAYSKWNLGLSSLSSGIPYFEYIGPAVLIASALLTAGYLLPVGTKAFFKEGEVTPLCEEAREVSKKMTVTVIVLAVLSVIIGIIPTPLTGMIAKIITEVFK